MKKIGLLLVMVFFCMVMVACGRTPSRFGGKEHRQILEVENMKTFISISYDFNQNSTVKDVTFEAEDGYVYTQEFKDTSPLEGMIRWVPANQTDSFIQTRAISRWTGTPVNLKLPEDCASVLGVDVTFSSEGERTKNLTYRSTNGNILSKEYREGLIDRNFEGWLEVKRK